MINLMLKKLGARLNNRGVDKIIDYFDEYGKEPVIQETRIFKEDVLMIFLEASLSKLNMLLNFKNPLTFIDDRAVRLEDLIIQGALLQALSSHALFECGREFVTNDSGVAFNPPKVSKMLMDQWTYEHRDYMEKIRIVRCDLGLTYSYRHFLANSNRE